MQTVPICGQCQVGMRPYRNGVTVIETAHNPPMPYKFWSADEWECPECLSSVIVGLSQSSRQPSRADVAHALGHLDGVRLWKEEAGPVDVQSMLWRWEEQNAR